MCKNTKMKTPALLEGQLEVGGVAYRYVDLPTMLGAPLAKLPFALRVLFENVARNMEGAERDEATTALLAWLENRHQRSRNCLPAGPRVDARHDQYASIGGYRCDA